MKTIKYTKLVIICGSIFLAQPSYAQFLKKLKDRVLQKTEHVVVEKTSNKVAEKASRSMDNAFEFNPFSNGANPVDMSRVRDEYSFSWKYTLKSKNKEGEFILEYFLEPGEAYFGFSNLVFESVFTVLDNENRITAMFMQSDEQNMLTASELPEDLELSDKDALADPMTFEEIPGKTILGYECQGVIGKSKRYEITMYFTLDAPINFNNIFNNKQKNIPPGLEELFGQNDNALMMEMHLVDLKKSRFNTIMECTGVEEIVKILYKKDYFMMDKNPGK